MSFEAPSGRDFAGPAPTPSFGQNVLGKLKFVGGKVVDLGGKVADLGGKVVDVGGTVGAAVGGKIVDLGGKLVDVTKTLGESDFERLKSLNQVAKQQQDLRRKYTEEELAAVEKRTDLVLGQLYSGYFEQDFDPVAYELSKLAEGDNQDQIDDVVERLTAGVETVSGRLSRHVMKKRDMLLEGIDRVAEVEDDLKAAFLITKTSRATLKAASEEVQRNMRVVGQTRRKQSYMELMEVCIKIKRVKDLQLTLKRSQELGEYGDAIMTCVQSFQGVDSLKQLTVSGELRALVQRLYVDTLRRLDGALMNICGEFNPEKYTKVLEGYLLQGMDGKSLADKVLQCFKDCINDVTTRVVRSLLLTKPKLADKLAASSALEASYSELCRALPVDMLRPCLLRLMEVMFDVLTSYHVMAYWHTLAVQKHSQMAAQSASSQGAGTDDAAVKAQAAMTSYLSAVNNMLQMSRPAVLEAASRRVKDLLIMENLFKGEDFLQMIDWCQKFVGMSEAFLSGPTELRPQVMQICARFLPAFHKSNLDSIKECLTMESWQDVVCGKSVPPLDLAKAVLATPLYVPAWGEPDATASFDKLMQDGNPFVRSRHNLNLEDGKQRTLLDIMAKTQNERSELSRSASHKSSLSGSDAPEDKLQSQASTTAAVPAAGPQPEASTGAAATAGQAPPSGERQGVSSAPQAEPSGRPSAGGQPQPSVGPARTAILTISSQHALKYMKYYAQIMRPLHAQAEYIWGGLAEMFDVYLLFCFGAFSGIGLEELCWRDDMLPPRLKHTLLRILIADGSRYKAIVEELMRNKPTGKGAPIASTGLSFLDRFGDKMESLADGLERSMNRMTAMTNNRLQAIGDGSGQAGQHQVQGSGASMVGLSQASVVGQSPVMGSPARQSSGGGATPQRGSPGTGPGQHHNLLQRVVAVQSLECMAGELRAGKSAILSVLPSRSHREVEQYYFHTVEASADLRDVLYRAAARSLMQDVWDSDKGIPAAISVTNYNVKEPALKHSPWADFTLRSFSTFKERLNGVPLPMSAVVQLWECAVAVAVQGILDGLANVRKCTLEGRANMTYDVNHIDRQVRQWAPPQSAGFRGNFSVVDAYVKSFYLPFDDLPQWCQTNLHVYGKHRLFTLIEVSAEFHKVKRQQKNELLERVEAIASGHAR